MTATKVGRITRASATRAEAEVTDEVHIGDTLQFQNNGGYTTGRVIDIATTRGQGRIANLEFEKPLREVPRIFTPLMRLPTRIPINVSLHLGQEGNGRNVWIRINALFGGLLIGGLTQFGKTHLGLVIAEELIEKQVPLFIIDSQGELTGLTATYPDKVQVYDEKASVAQLLRGLEKRKAAIVNLIGLSNQDKAEAVGKLLEDLKVEKERDYTHGSPTYPPIIVLIDEAEIYAPGHLFRAPWHPCRAVLQDMIKRMGKFGIGTILIAQRLPMLDPDSRSQCGSSAFFRLTDAGSLGIAKLMSYVTDHDVNLIRHLARGQCLLVGKAVPYSIVAHVKAVKSPRTKSLDFEKQLGLSDATTIDEEDDLAVSEARPSETQRTVKKLAEVLGVDANELTEAMPEIQAAGSRAFGDKRLEVREQHGEVFASVWTGTKCQVSVSLTGGKKQ